MTLPCHLLHEKDNADFIIDWTPVSLSMWRDLFTQARRAPITQSYDYARAIAHTSALRPQWGVIRNKTTNAPLGLVQLFRAHLFGSTIETIILDRGPVWFCHPSPNDHLAFWTYINRAYPARWGRARRLIPECLAQDLTDNDWAAGGLTPRPKLIPYQTIWIDTQKSEQDHLKTMRKTWRHDLKMAQGNPNLTLHHHTDIKSALNIIPMALLEAKTKGYKIGNATFLSALIRFAHAGDGLHIFTVTDQSEPVAQGLVIRHGSSATWQIGWVDDKGRDTRANYLLLWEMIKTLKSCGVMDLDLGGVNTQDAKGIFTFKSGLGGDHVTLAGAFK